MKKIMLAAVIAVLGTGSALAPAAAQDYGYRHNRNTASPEAPRAPEATRAPRENESMQGFTPYKPVQPYQGYKPLRHYNIYMRQWE